jgi:hypothetical protein
VVSVLILQTVINPQGTFTSLVYARAGRTKAIKRMVFKLHFFHFDSLHFMAKVQLKNHRLLRR